MKVRAKELCYYNLKRRRKGDVFVLLNAKDFQPKCMEHLNAKNNKAAPKSLEPKKIPIKDADGTVIGFKEVKGQAAEPELPPTDEVVAAEAAAAEDEALNSDVQVEESGSTQSDQHVI